MKLTRGLEKEIKYNVKQKKLHFQIMKHTILNSQIYILILYQKTGLKH